MPKRTYRTRRARRLQKKGHDVYSKGHWASVDPTTGKFLKSSSHPTLQKELDWYHSPAGSAFRSEHELKTKNVFGRKKKFYKYKKR